MREVVELSMVMYTTFPMHIVQLSYTQVYNFSLFINTDRNWSKTAQLISGFEIVNCYYAQLVTTELYLLFSLITLEYVYKK